jgi:hypothetical protein
MFHIEKNFITEEERLAVKQKVLDLKSYWNDLRPERYSNVNFSTLGNALYIMEAEQMPASQIDRKVQGLLFDNFNWLFQHICSTIADLTQKNTEPHPYLTAPGFHIGHKPGEYQVGFYHNDMSILSYDPAANMETNRSVLIPIELPSAGAGLLYTEQGQEKQLPYELGAFYQWDARLDHKVGGLKILEGEFRMTLQCHYYYNAEYGSNFLYF